MGPGRYFVAGAALAALLLVACGDDSDDSPGGARGRYIAQADPICAEVQGKVGTDLGKTPAAQRDDIRAGLKRLEALKAPSEEIETLQVFLIEVNNVTLSLEDVLQSREVNDQPRVARALTRAKEANKRATDAADRYGFNNCAQGVVGL